MAIYKSSNCSPQLSEIDFTENNTFSCVVNTSGEPVKAYKLKIMSEDGSETYYEPDEGTNLSFPVQNKEVLYIKNISNSLDGDLINGRNYLWGIRTYNASIGSTAQPNTLVTDGFVVGSTKYVIWSRIPKAQTSALEQLKYDRYIEFTNIAPANMYKGAKDDVYPLLPSSAYTERKKIDWVEKELGNDEDIVKIETTEPFTYNYDDGVVYNIYQCSDEHTVKSVYADPNSNINVSNFIMIYSTLTDARAARTAQDTPAVMTVTQAPCMYNSVNSSYSARKIGGYSSDTGEIRILDSFNVAPVNGQYYRLFEYDTIEKKFTAIDDTVSNNKDPLELHRIGGSPIQNDTYYKVLTNLWNSNTKRLFIQPNINILPDPTNPDEIVFANGARVNIVQNTTEVDNREIDITFNKLDNTQWLLEGNHLTYSGDMGPNIIAQTDYKVFTDFSDTSPYNLFYARKSPNIVLEFRNAWEKVLLGQYVNSTTFQDTEGNIYTPSVLYLYYDVPNDRYYRYDLNNHVYQQTTEVWFPIQDNPTAYKDFREAEFRCLWEDSLGNEMLDPQIKSYQFSLFAYDNNDAMKTLIAQSEEFYNITPHWTFRGLDGTTTSVYNRDNPHHYSVQIRIIDEYDKEYIVENGFYIYYVTDSSPMPISVNLNCDEQALDVEINSPAYATSIDSEGLITVYSEDLNAAKGQMVIPAGKILNYAKLSTDDIDLTFPSTFSVFTQFQITDAFVSSIPMPTVDTGFSELPLFEIVHRLYDIIVYSGTPYYLTYAPQYTTYYSDSSLTIGVGQLPAATPCIYVNSNYSTIILSDATYYIKNTDILAGSTENDITENITRINNNYSIININNTNYYISSNSIHGPLLEKFTVRLNSFASYYADSQNNLYRNNEQYKLKIYRNNETEALRCFNVNGTTQDYFNVINNNDDGTFPVSSIKYALQSLSDTNSKYEEVTTLGNPTSPTYDVNKRYILYTAAVGYANILYDAGIYRILENSDGHKYWALAGEDEYIFLENTRQLSSDVPVTYDDLSVPQNARMDSGTTGEIGYQEDLLGGNNVWLDTTLSTISYDKILYNRFVNLFFKVILNPDRSETITCEISIDSKGV